MSPRVLILDDSLTVRMDLHDTFSAAAFEATAVGTVQEARHALREGTYGLIVLDLMLPGPEGVAFLNDLRRDAGTAEMPVILLASASDVFHRLHGMALSTEDVFDKPYDRAKILARARHLLRVGRPQRESPVVLVIDDSATLRHAMRDTLEAAGYEVVLADSGEEGLRVAEAIRPDLFIIDGHLPGISGAMVIGRIRMDAALRRIPCLLLTASETALDELEALEAGADAYVRKSEGTGLILARANALLRARPAPSAIDRQRTADKILAVDDSPTYLEMLANELRAEGYEILLASSSERALPILERESVDAILLDMIMPGLSGADLCRIIKARSDWRDIPLAILSVADKPLDMIDGLNAGADDYIVKTNDFEVLKGRLRAQLRRKHFEDENRFIREELLRKELEATEARAAADLAEARALLLADLERKNAELAIAKERAEAGTLAKSHFLATMSHEIRTPLNALMGVADLLALSSLDPRQQGYVELMKRSGENLLTIINDILDLSKIEAGKLEFEQTGFKLSELIQRAAALGAVIADEKRIALDWRLRPETPDDLVGDPHRVIQILNNLLGNALKFTSAGSVTLEAGPDPRDPTPGALRFTIADTGIGIPESHQSAIFDNFTQADATTTRLYGGTGLGLPITRRLVEAMGGAIEVESTVGVGSTFVFTLKLQIGRPPALAAATSVPSRAIRALDILLAEDLEDNRIIFQAYLAGTVHHCEWVENGLVALESFKEGRFDLVLMDMQMPIMDGYAATAAIRQWEREHGRDPTPIVALTASALRHDIARCNEVGCNGHLSKPITRREFLRALGDYA